MREIKFRAWDGFKMYEPCVWMGKEYLPLRDTFIETEFMQFTGLKDKNGKEIYEGDILKYKDGTDVAHYTIHWDSEQARFFDTRLEDGDSQTNYDGFEFVTDCRVIGNIHENSDFLKFEPL